MKSNMIFGQYSALTKVDHVFEKEPKWNWVFKPTTSETELEIFQWSRQHPNLEWIEIAWRELAHSFGGTNITLGDVDPMEPTVVGAAEHNETPLLKPEASIAEIEAVLRQMPIEMVAELWRALGEANPLWGPRLDPEEDGAGSLEESSPELDS